MVRSGLHCCIWCIWIVITRVLSARVVIAVPEGDALVLMRGDPVSAIVFASEYRLSEEVFVSLEHHSQPKW